jgi:hypothetical protein
MVVATFSLSSPAWARAEAAALKGPEVNLTAWYTGAVPQEYRFIAGTAPDAHVLAVPPSLRYPPAFTPPGMRELEFTGGGWSAGQGSVHVTFYSVGLSRR